MTDIAALLGDGMSEQAVAKLTTAHGIRWWCTGCQCAHVVPLAPENPHGWQWNGSLVSPTLTPSVLVFDHDTLNAAGLAEIDAAERENRPVALTDAHRTRTPRCHSYIRDGWIEYLADSTHALAGQKTPLTLIATSEAPA